MALRVLVILTAISVLVSVTRAKADLHLYVSSGKSDNTGDGLGWATAKRDISAAICAAAGGEPTVLHVAPGTYPETTTRGRVEFGILQSGRTITILKDEADDFGGQACPAPPGPAVVISTVSAPVWFRTSCLAGTFIWDGVDVSTSVTSGYVVLMEDCPSTMSVMLRNCTLTSAAHGVYVTGDAGTGRRIKLESVSFVVPNGYIVNCGAVETMEVFNCTAYIRAGSTYISNLLQFGGLPTWQAKFVHIRGNTITCKTPPQAFVDLNNLANGTVILERNVWDGLERFTIVEGRAGSTLSVHLLGNRVTCRADNGIS